MGTSIVYQGYSRFPSINTDTYTALNAKANRIVLNKTLFSDQTRRNYRLITFVSSSGTTTKLKVKGFTIFNQPIEETVTLNGVDRVFTTNLYKYFHVIPEEDVDLLNIGFDKGMTDIITYDGSPTSHRIIVTGNDNVTYTIYGLLTLDTLTKAELDIQKFALDSNLKDQTATTTTVVYTPTVATRLFMEVSQLDPTVSLEWTFNTQSLI
jgi:hypothetical protein